MGSALKILIVEDDLKIAEMINEFLIGSGHEVCGIARSVAVALDLAKWQSPDIALIDVKLAEGGLGTDVAASLRATSMVGILYAAGDTSPEALRNAIGDACLAKPFRPADLLHGLELVASIVATGRATMPFPRGFRLLPQMPEFARSVVVGPAV